MILLLAFIISFLHSEKNLISYVDINFIQTANICKDALFSGGIVNGSVSLSYDLNPKNLMNLSYIVNYEGAGVWNVERDIKERTIKYSLLLEDHLMIDEKIRIRPQIYLGRQRFKDSATSSYDDNIYNNNIKGIGISADLIRDYNLTIYLNYRNIKYPNYTDLLSEIRYDSYYTQTGMYDKDLFEFGGRFKKNRWFYEISYTKYNYLNQKVIAENGTYSNKRQRDKKIMFIVGSIYEFNNIDFYPSIGIDIYSSNQNYLRYKSLFDISPYFISNAYSYNDYSIKLPFQFFKKKYGIGGEVNFIKRIYNSRPPRDFNNNYIISDRQKQTFFVISTEYIRNITEIAYYKIGYTLTVSNSNNKFELYVPYNYTNHAFYLGYGIRY